MFWEQWNEFKGNGKTCKEDKVGNYSKGLVFEENSCLLDKIPSSKGPD